MTLALSGCPQSDFLPLSPLSHPQRTKDAVDVESGAARRGNVFAFISRVFFEAFSLTFLAEWGDRSQIATILLGAREVGAQMTSVVDAL